MGEPALTLGRYAPSLVVIFEMEAEPWVAFAGPGWGPPDSPGFEATAERIADWLGRYPEWREICLRAVELQHERKTAKREREAER